MSPRLCDNIIEHCSKKLQTAKVGGKSDDNDPDKWWVEGKTIERKRKWRDSARLGRITPYCIFEKNSENTFLERSNTNFQKNS